MAQQQSDASSSHDPAVSSDSSAADDDRTFHTDPSVGLTSQEVEERRRDGKGNTLPERSGRSTWSIIKANVFTRINAMLGVLLVIVLATGSLINAMFGLLIIANSGIGIIQELRAKRTLDKLTIVGEARPAVRRDGEDQEISRDEVVLDDLIILKSGVQVVVDGVVVESVHVDIDESMLTGESDPVEKSPGDEVLSGSFVQSGHGLYQATKVGADSYAGKLTAAANKFELTDSELMTGINKILRIITWLLIPTGILTIWTQLFRSGDSLRDAVLTMVAALVPMVPEGLVLMTSIAFAVGVVRLGKFKALVNELPAIEGLARVDVVCTDKTGTLTENKMVLNDVVEVKSDRKSGSTSDSSVDEPLSESDEGWVRVDQEVLDALASLIAADDDKNDTSEAIGEGIRELDSDTEVMDPTDTKAFSSARKWSGASFGETTWVMGAPDVIAQPGSDAAQAADKVGRRGLRVLLLDQTSKKLDDITATPKDPGDDDLTPRGLIVLEQKVRDDAPETIEYFDREKMHVKVISGDNAESVGAVASSVGIDSSKTIDARELPDFESDQEKFDEVVEESTVFGRVTPEQKRAMVGALQRNNHTIAMTGDGVNDVLALKDANIGVAMGAGSPATRSVAQLVLLNNSFATLPHVVAEGRRVIGNIERVANLFLTKTVYSVLLALIVGIFGMSYPFQPIHVTMTGWFTIGIPAFILSLAPNHERAKSGFVSRVLWLAVPSGVLIGAVTVGFWLWVTRGDNFDRSQASTATLTVMITMALWVLIVVARPYKLWKIILLVVSALAYVVIFSVPWIAHILLLDPTNLGLMSQALIVGAVGCVAIEIAWWISHTKRGDAQLWDHSEAEGVFKY